MKITQLYLRKIVCTSVLLLFFGLITYAQTQRYTTYDDLPEIDRILKPNYSDDMPEWGKMLYSYPINFNTIDRAFTIWEANNKDKKTDLMRYYKLWRKAITPYVSYNGEISMPDVTIIRENLRRAQINSLKPRRAPAAGNNSNWTFWGPKQTFWLNESGSTTAPGPANWQANVYSFDVTEKNPNILYCGTETGFVNKSIDKGKTWTLCGLNYPFGGGITSVAINPDNSDTTLVSGGGSIHRTLDGGQTWATTGSFDASRMKFNLKKNSNLVACGSKGIFTSNNYGASWSQRTTRETWDVEYKPNSIDTVYALTTNTNNRFRILQSTTAGASFSEIASFPDSLVYAAGGLLAVTPKNPNVLYAVFLTKNMNTRPFVYKGTLINGTWSWANLYTGSDGAFTSGQLTNGQGYFDLVLEVSPLNENLFYVGTTSLFRSSNPENPLYAIGGYAGSFSIHPDIQDMKMLTNGDTWVVTDGGVNLSTDNFATSAKHQALNYMLIGSDLWGFHQGWNEDLIVGGRYHNGNTSIADFYGEKSLRMGGGESATGWVIQGKSRHVAFDDLGSGWILPKTAEGKPEGRFTFSKYPNMDEYGALRSNVVAHPLYSGQIYVGKDSSVWVSKDFGATFDLLYKFNGKVRYFDISTQNPDVIYVDVLNYGFYRSADGGATFSRKTTAFQGNTRFVISPYNSDILYASKSHGAWDSTRSEVYRSTDGGATWLLWSTFGTSVLIKTLAIQPTTDGKDLVYAFIDTYGSVSGTVKYKKDGDASWTDFGTGYPNGLRINHALPFYRDSKIRVGGTGGVWESPLAEPEFTPVVVPWVNKKQYDTPFDTIQFDCHSYLNHKDAVWTWSFSPEPKYISDIHARNPKVVFNEAGKKTVTLSITQRGITVSRTVADMVEFKSLDDCNNPSLLPRQLMSVRSVDSYQAGEEGSKAIDGNVNTLWHTAWSGSPAHPHNIQIDLGDTYNVSKLIYTPRPTGDNGKIKDYEIYITNDVNNWGTYVKKGTLTNLSVPSTLEFTPKAGRYAKLIALSEINGANWTSAAEIGFVGCKVTTAVNEYFYDASVRAFPIPTSNRITVNLPFQNGLNSYTYNVFSTSGQQITSGKAGENQNAITIDVQNYPSGYYFVILRDKTGITYRTKFIKK